MRNIESAVTDRGMTQVTGLNPGDVVATSSFDKLQDKSQVSVSNNPTSAPKNTAANAAGSTSP
jgi:membrane fusion protein, multidrug efflux system